MDSERGHSVFSSSPSITVASDNTASERSHEKGMDKIDLGSPMPPTPQRSETSTPEPRHPFFHPGSILPKVGTTLMHPRLPRIFPSVDFPNQGHGCRSEFNQTAPLWVCQPLKAVYTVFFILVTAFVYLPWQALRNIPRSCRGRPAWSWSRSMTVLFLRRCVTYICNTRVVLTKTPPQKEPKLKHSEFTWLEPEAYLTPSGASESLEKSPDFRGELARAMQVQGVGAKKICGYWYFAQGSQLHASTPARKDEQVLYYLHGGAYWMGSGHESGPTGNLAKKFFACLGGRAAPVPARLFALEYRLSQHTDFQHGSYPAALVDALVGYLYLVRACGFAPENVVLVGDSSGGNLAMALCRYLRDEGVAGVPGSLLLFSPWSDVSRSHSGPVQAPNRFSSVHENKLSDIIDASVLYRNTSVMAFLGKLPASEAYLNPYISPVSLQLDALSGGRPPHWGFYGFPKRTYIVTGSAELNAEQHVTLAHRLAQGTQRGVPEYVGDRISAGGDTEQFVWRGSYPRSHRCADRHQNTDHHKIHDSTPLDPREVVLDEVHDAIHVFPLFSWYEPERSQTMDRIASWIAHEAVGATDTVHV